MVQTTYLTFFPKVTILDYNYASLDCNLQALRWFKFSFKLPQVGEVLGESLGDFNFRTHVHYASFHRGLPGMRPSYWSNFLSVPSTTYLAILECNVQG
jgi:hypothetical protein